MADEQPKQVPDTAQDTAVLAPPSAVYDPAADVLSRHYIRVPAARDHIYEAEYRERVRYREWLDGRAVEPTHPPVAGNVVGYGPYDASALKDAAAREVTAMTRCDSCAGPIEQVTTRGGLVFKRCASDACRQKMLCGR